MSTDRHPPRKDANPDKANPGERTNPGGTNPGKLQERAQALHAALSHIAVCRADNTRLIGNGSSNTLFRRTASRPIRKLPLTPLQTYVWLHAGAPIAIDRLIDTICSRIAGIAPIDVAWVVTDLRRDGYLRTLPARPPAEKPS